MGKITIEIPRAMDQILDQLNMSKVILERLGVDMRTDKYIPDPPPKGHRQYSCISIHKTSDGHFVTTAVVQDMDQSPKEVIKYPRRHRLKYP